MEHILRTYVIYRMNRNYPLLTQSLQFAFYRTCAATIQITTFGLPTNNKT